MTKNALDTENLLNYFNTLLPMEQLQLLKNAFQEDKKSDFMNRLLAEADFGNAEKITIDGLRVEYDFGWGLIRRSNTSPYLILPQPHSTRSEISLDIWSVVPRNKLTTTSLTKLISFEWISYILPLKLQFKRKRPI